MPQARLQIRVAFHDVDASQRIHFTAFCRYMELAEHALMRSLGFPYATTLLDSAFPRVHIECDFHGAIRYDDVLTVSARVERVGARSWTVAFAAHPADDALPGDAPTPTGALATGKMTIVAMDPASERAREIPEALRRALSGEAAV